MKLNSLHIVSYLLLSPIISAVVVALMVVAWSPSTTAVHVLLVGRSLGLHGTIPALASILLPAITSCLAFRISTS